MDLNLGSEGVYIILIFFGILTWPRCFDVFLTW